MGRHVKVRFWEWGLNLLVIFGHDDLLEEIDDVLLHLGRYGGQIGLVRVHEIHQFYVATLNTFANFVDVVRVVLLLNDTVQHLNQVFELLFRLVRYFQLLQANEFILKIFLKKFKNGKSNAPAARTFNVSMYSNSLLSTT